MAIISIDGKQTIAQPGATVLQAALEAGVYIPHLCHHPDLTPAGRCRLCVVELKGRGLVASCQAMVEEGMEIRTESPLLTKMRQINLELLLSTHAGECLSCPKNTHCGLQTVASYIGIDEARFKQLRMATGEFPKDESNPFFVRDPNKCVLCGICVRTCHEVQGVGAIDFGYRGFATAVTTLGNKPLAESTCESCGECVVRCPTGALMPKDSRRPLREVQTTCTYCGVGCSLFLGVRGGEIVSARGDRDGAANRGHLCVKGRFGHGFIHSPERLTTPLIKRNGAFVEASWDEALDLVARRFREYRGDQFGAMASSRATNEDNYVVQKFTRAVMGTNNVDNCARLCHAPTVTGLSAAFGMGGGTNTISEIEDAACILVIGANSTHAHPVVGMRLRKAVRNGATLIVVDPRRIELSRDADLWLPLRPGTDVALIQGICRAILDEGLHDPQFVEERCDNFDTFARSLEPFDLGMVAEITGVPRESILQAARAYATQKPSLILYSLGITEHSHGSDNVLALANLAMLTGNVGKPSAGVMPLRGQNNVQGACDIGCSPGSYPGYQSVKDPEARRKFEEAWGTPLRAEPGLNMVDLLNETLTGKVKAMYLIGIDPAFSVADTHRVQRALEAAEFVVFQEIFLTGSAEFADVILPATSFAEKDGTFTNLERRVQRVRKVIEPIGDSRPDWWITCEIARRMGAQGFDYSDPAEILDEIARLTPSMAGLSFQRLEAGGIQWPCVASDHPGTPILHRERFNTPGGKGQLSALTYRPPAEAADAEYPLILTTGRSRYHYHLAMTTKVAGLVAIHPEELAWVNPRDAAGLGIEEGDRVRVVSRRGEVTVAAKVTKDVLPGTAYMTFHFYKTPTNVLTQQALDPASKTPEYKVTAVRIEKAAGK